MTGDQKIELAVQWVEDWTRENGGEPRLVTVTFGPERAYPRLNDIARKGGHITVRSRIKLSPTPGAVVAFEPDRKALGVALHLARTDALCVIESPATRVRGWAAAAGAVDLRTGTGTTLIGSGLDDAVETILWHGHDGWSAGYGRDQTRRVVRGLREAGLLDKAAILAAAKDAGKGTGPVRRLNLLIDGA